MPYDPVRDAEVAPSPSANTAPSPSPGPSRPLSLSHSPANSPHLIHRLPQSHPHPLATPHSERERERDRERERPGSSNGRLNFPPAFGEMGGGQHHSNIHQTPGPGPQYNQHHPYQSTPGAYNSSHNGSHTPYTPGQALSTPRQDIYRTPGGSVGGGGGGGGGGGYFDIPPNPNKGRTPSGGRSGWGDLLNGPTDGYERPRSSSGRMGTPGSNILILSEGETPGGGGGEGSRYGSQRGSVAPSEKRGNSLSMLLNESSPNAIPSTSTSTPTPVPPPPRENIPFHHHSEKETTPSVISHYTNSPTIVSVQPLPIPAGYTSQIPPSFRSTNRSPAPGDYPSSSTATTQSESSQQHRERERERVTWGNSFGQGRPSPANDIDRPYNPAQRLISPGSIGPGPGSMSRNGSMSGDADGPTVGGPNDRRRGTVSGWSGESSGEALMPPGQGQPLGLENVERQSNSIGGSSGSGRGSVGSIVGYDPAGGSGLRPSAFGSGPMESGVRRSSETGMLGIPHRNGEGSSSRRRSEGRIDPLGEGGVRPGSASGTGPIGFAGGHRGSLSAQIDLGSPRAESVSLVPDGFTSTVPAQKQRRKSKKEIAREAKETVAAAAASAGGIEPMQVDEADSRGASPLALQRGSISVLDGGATSHAVSPSPVEESVITPSAIEIKPKAPRKRKTSNAAPPTSDGSIAKPRPRGRPKKLSTQVDATGSNSPAPIEDEPQPLVVPVIQTNSTKPVGMPYNPTNRVSAPYSMNHPLTPQEMAFLMDPRNSRNPLKRIDDVNGSTSLHAESAAGPPTHASGSNGAKGGDHKRRRDSEEVSPRRAAEGMDDEAGPSDGHLKRQRQSSPAAVASVHNNPASHYNARPNQSREIRANSNIVGLKKFNNWVKSVMIRRFTQRRPGTVQEPLYESRGRERRFRPNGRVLDLGCGKGGDIAKWDKADIQELIGIDIADVSIQDYKDRLGNQRGPLCYETSLYVLDCYSSPISDVLSKSQLEPLFDNVSMQFCIHYAFKSVTNVRMMLENISRYLRPGGVFFGTTLSAEKILDLLSIIPEGDPLTIVNPVFKITFDEREHKGAFGHAYSFYLEDAIDDCIEYIVNWEEFVDLAKEYKLECVYREDFDSLFEQEKEDPLSARLAEKMGVMQGNAMMMDEHQWQAATMYLAFAFERQE